MKISFRCTYRGKLNGFYTALLNDDNGVLSLCSYERTGTERSVVSQGYSPLIRIIVFTNENGKLECAVSGLGRRTNLSESPWSEGDHEKIATVVFCEEEESDRAVILSIIHLFTRDFYGYGNRLLDSVILSPEIEGIEYSISREQFEPIISEAKQITDFQLTGNLLPNGFVLFYAPAGLEGNSGERLIEAFKKQGLVNVCKKHLYCDVCAKEDFIKAISDFQFESDNASKPIFSKLGNKIKKSFNVATEAIKRGSEKLFK